MDLYGPLNSINKYVNGVRRGVYGNYQLTGRNLSLFGKAPMTATTRPVSIIGKVGKLGGYTLVGISTAVYLYGLYIYKDNPNAAGAVSPAKFGTNLGVSIIGLAGNPVAAIVYFGIDSFYPGGWTGDATHPGAIMDQDRLYKENRGIDPNWRLWPIGSKQ